MPEAIGMEHIERHGLGGHLVLRHKCESCLWIDITADQPSGCAAIHAGTGSRYPDPVLVFSRIDFLSSRRRFGRSSRVCVRQKLRNALLQWAAEEIHIDNLLKAAAQPCE